MASFPDPPSESSRSGLRWSLALPWLVLGAGLVITWVLWQGAMKAQDQRAQAVFDFRVRDLSARLVQRMQAYEQVLLGANGLFSASHTVDRAEFHNYIAALKLAEHYPGIQGVGFAKVIRPEEKAGHIEAIRLEGFAEYTLRPEGERELYTSIIYLEPFEGRNLRAFGYDMFTEPTRRAAMEQARDSGGAVLSGKVRLVQETEREGQAGVLLYLPVYRHGVPHDSLEDRRASLVGWVYEPFRMNDLMAGIFGEHPSDLAISVHDGGELSESTLMYDDGGEGMQARAPRFQKAVPLEVVGRVWTLTVRSKPSFEAAVEGPGAAAIGASGVGISILLLIITWSLTSLRRRAERLARVMTVSLREKEEFLRTTLDHLPVALFCKDADNDFRFTLWNQYSETLFGLGSREVVGRSDYDFFPHEQADAFRAMDRQVMQAGTFIDVAEEPVDTKGRGRTILHTIKAAVPDASGRPRFLLGISEDITARKQAESELIAAKVEAERANQAKSAFLSSMSHELRTPLNAIIGFAELLEYDTGLSDEQKEYVRTIGNAGEHLLKLINDVLDFAKIEADRVDLVCEDLDVEAILHICQELSSPLANRYGIALHFSAPPAGSVFVRGDRVRLKQVLLNLISNAVKYNREGGSVTVDYRLTPVGTVRLSVADTGPGIPPERRSELFEPFNRLGAQSSSVEGTGIGLTITKRLVELMGGTIGLESELGRGSTFWVELPAAVRQTAVGNAAADVLAAAAAPAQPGQRTVLYVEDNDVNLTLVKHVIAKRRPSYRLLAAERADIGVELARQQRPDLILMDISLPGMDGYQALEILSGLAETRNIPVIAISANAMPGDIQRGLAAGFKDYVEKPIQAQRLVAVLDHWLA